MNSKYKYLNEILKETGKNYYLLSKTIQELEKAGAKNSVEEIKTVITRQKIYLRAIEDSKTIIAQMALNNEELEKICKAFGWQIMKKAVVPAARTEENAREMIRESLRNRFNTTETRNGLGY